jgi:ATP-binding cassette, subfamily B, bacterial MsbA
MEDFRRLLKYLRPHLTTFLLASAAMVMVAVFETAMGAMLVPMADQAFSPANAQRNATLFNLQDLVPRDNWFAAWAVMSGMILVFTIGSGIAEYFSSSLMAKIGQSAVLKLRQDLYDHLLAQSAGFFGRHRTNFLVSRLVTSATAIELAVSSNLRDVLRESFMLVFFLSSTFYFNWRLMTGALVLVPVIAGATSKFSKTLRHLSQESFEGTKLLTDTAQETLSNHTIVSAYSAEDREKRRFSDIAARIARANLRSYRIGAAASPTITIIGVLSVVVLLFFGLREINLGRMEASQFFTFLFFLFRTYDPMRKLSRQHNELNRAFAATRDVWNVLDEDDSLPEKAGAVELEALTDRISVRNVSFNYGIDDKVVVKNIDLDVPVGSMVALVGESGGGKSTLIKLIQRLYDPTSGSITWDGVDLRDATVSSLRKRIALVTQETVLFNESIRYNITYGRPDAGEELLMSAANIAYADEFIRELPEGYDTVVGERGIFLSGGQRQRIAIARAVLVDAPVLILDEATSALDAESERMVQKALANLTRGRTSVVIAHRLSTVRRADKIVVMEKGRIVESGSHEELLSADGSYKRLYELQFADEEIVLATV